MEILYILFFYIFIFLSFPSTWVVLSMFFLIYKYLKKIYQKRNYNFIKNETIKFIVKYIFIFIYVCLSLITSMFATYKYAEFRENYEHKKMFEVELEKEKYYDYFIDRNINLKEVEATLKEEFEVYCTTTGLDSSSGEDFIKIFNKRYVDYNLGFKIQYEYFSLEEVKLSVKVYPLDDVDKCVTMPISYNKEAVSDEVLLKARERMTFDYLYNLRLLGDYVDIQNFKSEEAVLVEDFNEPNKEKVQLLSKPFKLFAIYENETSLIEPLYFEIENDYLVKSKNKNNEEDNIRELIKERYKKKIYEGDYDIYKVEFISYRKEDNYYIGEVYLWWGKSKTKTPYKFIIKDYSNSLDEISGYVEVIPSVNLSFSDISKDTLENNTHKAHITSDLYPSFYGVDNDVNSF